MDIGYTAIGAALAVGIGGLGVGLGQSMVAKASVEILGMNPRLASTIRVYSLLGIALVETAVIYALIIAFRILGDETLTTTQAIAAGLVMGLTAFASGYGEGKMVSSAMEAVNRNPDNKGQVLQFMILYVALIETVAVYGLIVAFKILG